MILTFIVFALLACALLGGAVVVSLALATRRTGVGGKAKFIRPLSQTAQLDKVLFM